MRSACVGHDAAGRRAHLAEARAELGAHVRASSSGERHRRRSRPRRRPRTAGPRGSPPGWDALALERRVRRSRRGAARVGERGTRAPRPASPIPNGPQPRLHVLWVEVPGERLGEHVAGHVALQHFVAFVEQLREGALGDRDERQLVWDLEQREARACAPLSASAAGRRLCAKPVPKPSPAMSLRRRAARSARAGRPASCSCMPGRQQQLAAFQPRRRVRRARSRAPSARACCAALCAADELEPELADQALDGELHCSHPLAGLASARGAGPPRSPRTARARDQRRRELHDRVAAVVGAADQAALVELAGEEAAQQLLGLLVR